MFQQYATMSTFHQSEKNCLIFCCLELFINYSPMSIKHLSTITIQTDDCSNTCTAVDFLLDIL